MLPGVSLVGAVGRQWDWSLLEVDWAGYPGGLTQVAGSQSSVFFASCFRYMILPSF